MTGGFAPSNPHEPDHPPDRRVGNPREEVGPGWVNFRLSDGSVFDCRSQRRAYQYCHGKHGKSETPECQPASPIAKPRHCFNQVIITPTTQEELGVRAFL